MIKLGVLFWLFGQKRDTHSPFAENPAIIITTLNWTSTRNHDNNHVQCVRVLNDHLSCVNIKQRWRCCVFLKTKQLSGKMSYKAYLNRPVIKPKMLKSKLSFKRGQFLFKIFAFPNFFIMYKVNWKVNKTKKKKNKQRKENAKEAKQEKETKGESFCVHVSKQVFKDLA